MYVYETHRISDPRLPFIFHAKTVLRPNYHSMQPNWHENVEILHILSGSGVLLCDTKQIAVAEGDTVVINPNSLHSFDVAPDGISYHCLIVDRTFCIANHFDTNTIRFEDHFRDTEVNTLMHALCDEYASPAPPYRIPMIRALVLSIMARLCRYYSHPERGDKQDSHLLSCIKQAIGLIRSDASRDLSLDEIAEFVGLSKYYFAREFRRVTGYTFVSYINLTRCEKAKALLTQNKMNIGEIGRACGFSNQSYFTRTFRTYTGMLPGVYRDSHSSKHN
ncbi:MAG: helix-turn-helix transcriptional regulator [Clostridia bacterium]|nr:helix-turn-helix transcriptional regulator [Clostridia bacterium]